MRWKNRGHEYDDFYQKISEKMVFTYLVLVIMGINFGIYLAEKYR